MPEATKYWNCRDYSWPPSITRNRRLRGYLSFGQCSDDFNLLVASEGYSWRVLSDMSGPEAGAMENMLHSVIFVLVTASGSYPGVAIWVRRC